jgi:hypothetical protein
MWIADPMNPLSARQGVTYAIASEPFDGWVKLGRSTKSGQVRLRSLQTGNPRRLALAALWTVDYEALLHEAYAEFRGVGEWFALPLPLVEFMRSVAEDPNPVGVLLAAWSPAAVRAHAGDQAAATPEDFARIWLETAHKPRTRTLQTAA